WHRTSPPRARLLPRAHHDEPSPTIREPPMHPARKPTAVVDRDELLGLARRKPRPHLLDFLDGVGLRAWALHVVRHQFAPGGPGPALQQRIFDPQLEGNE